MKKLILIIALVSVVALPSIFNAHASTTIHYDPPCAGGTIDIGQTVDKSTVVPGDSFGETIVLTNTGSSTVSITTVGRLEDPSGNLEGESIEESVTLDPAQSKTFYDSYHIACAGVVAGIWSVTRVVRPAVGPPACANLTPVSITVAGNSMCAGYPH